MNEWCLMFGISLSVESRVCERHFKKDDILTFEYFIPDIGLCISKRLKNGVLPKIVKKYRGKLKGSRGDNVNEDISLIKNRNLSNGIKIFIFNKSSQLIVYKLYRVIFKARSSFLTHYITLNINFRF